MVKKFLRKAFEKLGVEVKRTGTNTLLMPFASQKELLDLISIKNPVIFDVGANRGKITDIYLRLFQNPRLYAFEPFEELHSLLQKKYADINHVDVYDLAVSNQSSQTSFI